MEIWNWTQIQIILSSLIKFFYLKFINEKKFKNNKEGQLNVNLARFFIFYFAKRSVRLIIRPDDAHINKRKYENSEKEKEN